MLARTDSDITVERNNEEEEEASSEIQELLKDVNQGQPRDHKRVIELVRKFPNLALVPLIKCKYGSSSRTILNQLVQERAPLEVIRGVVEASPGSVRAPETDDDFLPIHTACWYKKDYSDVIIYLVQQYPESLMEKYKGNADKLPIHQLVQGEVGILEAIKYMVSKVPGLVSTTDKFGFLPLHCACGPSLSTRGDPLIVEYMAAAFPDGLKVMTNRQIPPTPTSQTHRNNSLSMALLFTASTNERENHPRLETVQLFLDLCPECVTFKDSLGRLPLSIACATPLKIYNWDVMCLLATKHPEALRGADQNRGGCLPIHDCISKKAPLEVVHKVVELYPECLSKQSQWLGTPLHHACCCSNYGQVIQYLAKRNPSILMMRGRGGQLPLHQLITSKRPSKHTMDTVQLLIKLCPQALLQADSYGRLPLVRACQEKHSDVIAYLCEHHPNATWQAAGGSIKGQSWIPLHALLQAYMPSLEDVKRLVEIRPESVWQGSSAKGVNALSYACGGNDMAVFAYCCQRFPTTEKSLKLCGGRFNLNKEIAVLIGGLLPQLEFFHCEADLGYDYDGEGWFHLIDRLQGNTSILDLTMTVPMLLLASSDGASVRFTEAIMGSSVRNLTIWQRRSDSRIERKFRNVKQPEWNVAKFVVDMISRGQTSSLAIEGNIPWGQGKINAILDALRNNNHLQTLWLPSLALTKPQIQSLLDIVASHNVTLNELRMSSLALTKPQIQSLLDIVASHNVTLNELRMSSAGSCNLMEHVLYYVRLNGAGRAKIHDPNATRLILVKLLVAQSKSKEPINQVNACFGLLSESLSLWCEVGQWMEDTSLGGERGTQAEPNDLSVDLPTSQPVKQTPRRTASATRRQRLAELSGLAQPTSGFAPPVRRAPQWPKQHHAQQSGLTKQE
ncbi:Ankyrin Repeat [Seminavis robusta]|uniref:Ankyrin Repeat n=1 Tax=Seminavis robusta TaxID=568900 RepID=A0A9N8HWP4_9STRA|nr:Ankyrin Repeat [Seminavis robusta]|eukprot:Sro2269_g321360.1 Ankyrin Repeat (902) ;mRNA; r:5721-8426